MKLPLSKNSGYICCVVSACKMKVSQPGLQTELRAAYPGDEKVDAVTKKVDGVTKKFDVVKS